MNSIDDKRMLRIERSLNALKHHLYMTDKLLLALATDVADLKCETSLDNPRCQEISREIESLKTFRDIINR